VRENLAHDKLTYWLSEGSRPGDENLAGLVQFDKTIYFCQE